MTTTSSTGPALADVALPAAPPEVHALLADLHKLPAQRPVLLRVVQVADDPDCDVPTLSDAAALDPAFTARLLGLANSAHYGRSRRVTSLSVAVGVLGADTLRGLAVTMALGLSGEHGPVPAGFWDRAAATAAGAQVAAPHLGADPGDAICVGLLHEVGRALLFRAAPHAYSRLVEDVSDADLPAVERAWCGTTSGELSAAALRTAGLPEVLCSTIASHEADDEHGRTPTEPLARALRGGVLLSRAVATDALDQEALDELDVLLGGRLDGPALRGLALRTAAQAAALGSALT